MSGFSTEMVSRLVQIVLVNLVLSGDNAVMIGLAAHPLPSAQRKVAIVIGSGSAIGIRIVLTGLAALLLGVPGLRAVGGVLLLWIAFRLLEEEEASAAGAKIPTTLRGAVATIVVADLIMSLDNVLGVAGASAGDMRLLVIGLVISMIIVAVGGGLIAGLMDREWWLIYLGAAFIAWTGSEMCMTDDIVGQAAFLAPSARLLVSAAVSLCVVGLAHRIHRHGSREARSGTVTATRGGSHASSGRE